jgi:catalase
MSEEFSTTDAGTLVREVLGDDARDRLAHNIIGHVSNGVRDLGKTVEEGVRANVDGNGA